jgi:serine protease Do
MCPLAFLYQSYRQISMRLLSKLSILFVALLFTQTAFADPSDISAISRSVVRVAAFSDAEGTHQFIGHGSGVAIAPDIIVTNAHVVSDSINDETMSFMIIPPQGGRSFAAKVLNWSSNNDLAVLQITDGGRLPVASLFTGTITDGADVFAIGYPASVDIALGQDEVDILRPQSPVKTHGFISAGRTGKAFDSLLHTAPIAPGNSGGPLVDACGRVVGINSFGSTAEGGGAEFYFAVSMRELTAYLRKLQIAFKVSNDVCRSVAELNRAESDLEAAARAKVEAATRLAAAAQTQADNAKRQNATYAVITSRENRIALAGLMIFFALTAAGGGYVMRERAIVKGTSPNLAILTGIAGGTLLLGALLVFASRPSFDEIEARVRATDSAADEITAAPTKIGKSENGKQYCKFQKDRSKVTTSKTDDVTFDWSASGCINGHTQYADDSGLWSRGFVPNAEEQVSLVSYTPAENRYRIERYQLGQVAIEQARAARKRYDGNSCSADPAARAKVSEMNSALKAILPVQPTELLVYSCSATQ